MSRVSLSSQSRNFHLVLYPDATNYTFLQIVFEDVVNLKFCSKWAWSFHDKDVDDNGNAKKKHAHLVLNCKYPVRYCDVLSSLSLPESSITLPESGSKTRTFRSMVRYLIHADSPKKFQYDVTDIHSNFDVSSFFSDCNLETSSQAFMDLLDFMSQKGVTRRQIALYACSSGLLGYYRQYYRILWDIRDYEEFSSYNHIKSIDNDE